MNPNSVTIILKTVTYLPSPIVKLISFILFLSSTLFLHLKPSSPTPSPGELKAKEVRVNPSVYRAETLETLTFGDNVQCLTGVNKNLNPLSYVTICETSMGVTVCPAPSTSSSSVDSEDVNNANDNHGNEERYEKLTLPYSAYHVISAHLVTPVAQGVEHAKNSWLYKTFILNPSRKSVRSTLENFNVGEMKVKNEAMRLAACVLPVVNIEGKRFLIITRRKAKRVVKVDNASGVDKNLPKVKPRPSTFSNMWVYPGGHSDIQNGKCEKLKTTAIREFSEETGLKIKPSTIAPLCSYQAGLLHLARSYFICFFYGDVELEISDDTDLVNVFKDLQVNEVSAIALLPIEHVNLFTPKAIGGSSVASKQAIALASVENNVVRGILVDQETNVITNSTFTMEELVGSGGEGFAGGGVGMAHRFAMFCFLERIKEQFVK